MKHEEDFITQVWQTMEDQAKQEAELSNSDMESIFSESGKMNSVTTPPVPFPQKRTMPHYLMAAVVVLLLATTLMVTAPSSDLRPQEPDGMAVASTTVTDSASSMPVTLAPQHNTELMAYSRTAKENATHTASRCHPYDSLSARPDAVQTYNQGKDSQQPCTADIFITHPYGTFASIVCNSEMCDTDMILFEVFSDFNNV